MNISASPWNVGKEKLRHDMLASLARKSRRPVLLCNMAGGNDELIFDGTSMAFNAAGELIARARAFEEDFVVVDTSGSPVIPPPACADEENMCQALVLGLRDYLRKCGFKSAVIGLSGGIDSALVACLAVRGAGREKCPGRFAAVAVFIARAAWKTRGYWRRGWASPTTSFRSSRRSLRCGNSCNRYSAGCRKTPRKKTSRRGCAGSF